MRKWLLASIAITSAFTPGPVSAQTLHLGGIMSTPAAVPFIVEVSRSTMDNFCQSVLSGGRGGKSQADISMCEGRRGGD